MRSTKRFVSIKTKHHDLGGLYIIFRPLQLSTNNDRLHSLVSSEVWFTRTLGFVHTR